MEKRLRIGLLSILLAIALVCTAVVTVLLTHQKAVKAEVSEWDGNLIAAGWGDEKYKVTPGADVYTVTYENGESGKVKTVEIGSAAALAYFVHELYEDGKTGTHNYNGVTVTLTTDIDLGCIPDEDGKANIWIPIGSTSGKSVPNIGFNGTFDGNGKTIYNLGSAKFFENIVDHDGGNYVAYPSKNAEDKIYIPVDDSNGEYNYGFIGNGIGIEIKDLTIKGVDLSFDAITGATALKPKNVGTILAYAIGEPEGTAKITNCVSGSEDLKDKLSVSVAGCTTAGLVGKFYVHNGSTSDKSDFNNVKIDNCKNYVNVVNTAEPIPGVQFTDKVAGVIGFVAYFAKCDITNCTNYGNVIGNESNGGQNVGGIISYWSNDQGYTGDLELNIFNCDNYGNISSGYSGAHCGGIAGNMQNAATNAKSFTFNVTDSNNFGNISSKSVAGGIIGTNIVTTTKIINKFINNYNYGNVYGLASGSSGGYIGSISLTNGGNNENLTISGGNLGNVYSKGAGAGSLIGNTPGTSNHVYDVKVSIVNAGTVEKSLETLPEIPAEHSNATRERYKETTNDETFKYYVKGEEKVIIGFVDSYKLQDGKLVIPSDVTKIGYGAFAGRTDIEEVDFSAAAKLTVIADLAFAGVSLSRLELPENLTKIGAAAFAANVVKLSIVNETGGRLTGSVTETVDTNIVITNLTLPGSVSEIGTAAFADIAKLNYVQLSEDAGNIAVGENAFKGTRFDDSSKALGAYVIAANNAQYRQLAAADSFVQSEGILTHIVAIKYYYNGAPIKESGADNAKDYVEYRLHGQKYKIMQKDGLWKEDTVTEIGPSGNEYVWYYGTENRPYAQEGDMDNLLATINADTIVLNSYADGSRGKEFIALDNLVYGQFTTATDDDIASLNGLLVNVSAKITKGEITIYYGSENKVVHEIKAAGTYRVEVKEDAAVYTFTVNVAPAPLNLADLNNLEWFITEIGETKLEKADYVTLTPDLVSGSKMLYIYKDKDGSEYPTWDPLSDEQLTELGLKNEYVTREVLYSVVRNRGDEVTIEVVGDGFKVIKYNDGNHGKDVGKYTASVILEADNNHVFTVGNIIGARGLTIDLAKENTEATITKDWYIVDYGNWLVDSSDRSKEYSVPNFIFGQAPNFSAPSTYYIGEGSEITMELYYGGSDTPVQDTNNVSEFGTTAASYGQYINSTMPAGDYRLVVRATGITFEDKDGAEIYINGFTEVFTFTVAPALMSSNDKATAVYNALKNNSKPFEFNVELNSTGLYNGAADRVVKAFTDDYVVRAGVWTNAAYNNYYDNYTITFNLLRNYNDTYSATVNTSKVDEYTVYYKLSGNNYYSNIDEDSRYNYSFTVVRYKILNVPTVMDVTYTGNSVLPTVVDESGYSDKYDVIWSQSEYIDGGTYSVKFKLYDNNLYRWKDDDGYAVYSDEYEREFNILQAQNDFIVALNLVGWSYSSFDAAMNSIRATAKYLDKGADIHFSVWKKGDSAAFTGLGDFTVNGKGQVADNNVIAVLKALPAGDYVLYATIADSVNYLGLTRNIEFAVSKAYNTWKDGEDDLLLPNWIEGRYSKEDNPIQINAEHGTVKYRIEDLEGTKVYYESTNSEADLVAVLNEMGVGTYLLIAWVDGDDNFSALAERTFRIQIFEKPGLPWWAVLLIVVGSLGLAALIVFILWKKGVFQIVTDKLLVAIRTRVSIEATIASVRAAKKMEEGRKSVADAKRKERLEQAREKQRSMTPEERAAQLEAKAQANAERAEKLRAKSEADLAKVEKMRKENAASDVQTEEQSEVASTDSETPSEE